MTAQPSSQAEREDVAREVLADVGIEVGFGGTIMWRGNVITGTAVIAAMLAFSDREHATPRSMPEEVEREGCVGTMNAERAVYFLERFKRDEKMLGPHEQWALDFAIRVLIPGASA